MRSIHSWKQNWIYLFIDCARIFFLIISGGGGGRSSSDICLKGGGVRYGQKKRHAGSGICPACAVAQAGQIPKPTRKASNESDTLVARRPSTLLFKSTCGRKTKWYMIWYDTLWNYFRSEPLLERGWCTFTCFARQLEAKVKVKRPKNVKMELIC